MGRRKVIAKEKRINARVNERDFQALEKIAKKKEVPISHLIRTAIKNFLIEK